MNNFSLIISINVHENINFLFKQLYNIDEYVNMNYLIILNCNNFMFDNLKNNEYILKSKNIVINPIFFEKKRCHGSLLKGIYLNLIYILNKKYIFDRFLILSSRTFFFRKIENFNSINKITLETNINYKIGNLFKIESIDRKIYETYKFMNKFRKTSIYNFYNRNKEYFILKTAHEGLMFDYNNCLSIENFFKINKKKYKLESIFNFHAACEEFALQTICFNENKYIYNIGCGDMTYDDKNNIPSDRALQYVHKIIRK